jgi:hypothetical protein
MEPLSPDYSDEDVLPFRTPVCPGCAYALDGLPAESPCPECGRPADRGELVLVGEATGDKANFRNASGRRALRNLGFIPILLVLLLGDKLTKGWSRLHVFDWAMLAVLAGYVIAATVMLQIEPRTQVRLSPAGCRQCDSDADAEDAPVTPWREIADAGVHVARDKAVTLRFVRCGRRWVNRDVLVDAEVRCTPEQAQFLATRIYLWRSEAGAPEPAKSLCQRLGEWLGRNILGRHQRRPRQHQG